MKIYSPEEYAQKLVAQAMAGPTVDTGEGKPLKAAHPVEIRGLEKGSYKGEPCLILYVFDCVEEDKFGVVVDKMMAEDLTRALGPHPLVEEFFKVH